MTIVPYPHLLALQTYTLTVTISDASGNTNVSSVDFVIDEDDAATSPPDTSEPVTPDDEDDNKAIANLIEDPVVQIALLAVVILVIVAFIRTRKYELDYSQPIEDDLFDD